MRRMLLLGLLTGLLVPVWLPTVASGAPKCGETYAKVWIASAPEDWPPEVSVYSPVYADLRVEKTIRMRRGANVGVLLDMFNVLNRGVPDSSQSWPIWQVSGPAFGDPTFWTDPRIVRAGLRYTF